MRMRSFGRGADLNGSLLFPPKVTRTLPKIDRRQTWPMNDDRPEPRPLRSVITGRYQTSSRPASQILLPTLEAAFWTLESLSASGAARLYIGFEL
ncbi:MAG: hypothetical protein Q9173_001631 [Seirophora scorigena]